MLLVPRASTLIARVLEEGVLGDVAISGVKYVYSVYVDISIHLV